MALKITPRIAGLSPKNAGVFFAVLAFFVQAFVVLGMPSAFAASTIVVNAANQQGWTTAQSDGGTALYVASTGAPLSQGALQLTTTSSNSSRISVSHSLDIALGDLSTLSFKTRQIAAADTTNGNVTMRISIDTSGDGTTDDQLMYEPYYNGFNGTSMSGWQTWNVASGKFWSNEDKTYNGLGGVSAGSYASNFTLADVLHDYPQAKVTGVAVSMGTWNPSQTVLVDSVVINDTTYDFDPTPPSMPANLRLNNTQPCGYTTNINWITPTWDAVAGAVSYNYKVTLPNGSTFGPVSVGNVTSVSGSFGGEGLSTFSVQAVDANGLTSEWASACAVTYDATAPTISDIGFAQNPIKDQLVVTGTVNDSNLKDYNLRVYDATHTAQVVPWTGYTGTTSVLNDVLGTLDMSALPQGDYYLRIWADDRAGNRTGIASQIFVPFTIDRTAPSIQITSAIRNNDGTYTIKGTTDDSSEVVVTIGSTTLASVTPDQGVWQVITGELASGTYSVTASSTDGVGNRGDVTLTPSLTVPSVSGPSLTTSTTQLPQLAVTPAALGAQGVVPTNQADATNGQTDTEQDTQVLGAKTTNSSNSDKVAAIVPSSEGWKVLGIAWYWWLIVLVGVSGIWWLVNRFRRQATKSPVDF